MYYSPFGIPVNNTKTLEVGDLVRAKLPSIGYEYVTPSDIRKVTVIRSTTAICIEGLEGTWNNPNYLPYIGAWELLDVVQHKEKSPIKQKFMAIVNNVIKPLPLCKIPVGSYIINNYKIPTLVLTNNLFIQDLDKMVDAIFKDSIICLKVPNNIITDLYKITEIVLQMVERKNKPVILS